MSTLLSWGIFWVWWNYFSYKTVYWNRIILCKFLTWESGDSCQYGASLILTWVKVIGSRLVRWVFVVCLGMWIRGHSKMTSLQNPDSRDFPSGKFLMTSIFKEARRRRKFWGFLTPVYQFSFKKFTSNFSERYPSWPPPSGGDVIFKWPLSVCGGGEVTDSPVN